MPLVIGGGMTEVKNWAQNHVPLVWRQELRSLASRVGTRAHGIINRLIDMRLPGDSGYLAYITGLTKLNITVSFDGKTSTARVHNPFEWMKTIEEGTEPHTIGEFRLGGKGIKYSREFMFKNGNDAQKIMSKIYKGSATFKMREMNWQHSESIPNNRNALSVTISGSMAAAGDRIAISANPAKAHKGYIGIIGGKTGTDFLSDLDRRVQVQATKAHEWTHLIRYNTYNLSGVGNKLNAANNANKYTGTYGFRAYYDLVGPSYKTNPEEGMARLAANYAMGKMEEDIASGDQGHLLIRQWSEGGRGGGKNSQTPAYGTKYNFDVRKVHAQVNHPGARAFKVFEDTAEYVKNTVIKSEIRDMTNTFALRVGAP